MVMTLDFSRRPKTLRDSRETLLIGNTGKPRIEHHTLLNLLPRRSRKITHRISDDTRIDPHPDLNRPTIKMLEKSLRVAQLISRRLPEKHTDRKETLLISLRRIKRIAGKRPRLRDERPRQIALRHRTFKKLLLDHRKKTNKKKFCRNDYVYIYPTTPRHP